MKKPYASAHENGDRSGVGGDFVVSVDPGLPHCGLAIFHAPDGLDADLFSEVTALIHASLIKNPVERPRGSSAVANPELWGSLAEQAIGVINPLTPVGNIVLVLEIPQVYQERKTDPADLIELAAFGGTLYGMLKASRKARGVAYKPSQWKGQVPKDVMSKRIEGRLTPGERGRVVLPSQKIRTLDVWDAIGIGLKFLGRL